MGAIQFRGRFEHSLDEKGRIILPSTFRQKLGENAVMSVGLDESTITIYPEEEWNRLQDSLSETTLPDPVLRDIQIVLNTNAVDVEIDKQGRVKIPDYLLSVAKITKNVCIVGNASKIEIRDLNTWNQKIGNALKVYNKNIDNLTKRNQKKE